MTSTPPEAAKGEPSTPVPEAAKGEPSTPVPEPPEILRFRKLFEEKKHSNIIWQEYSHLHDNSLSQHLTKPDYNRLRRALDSSRDWGIDGKILQSFEDMQKYRIAWDLKDYEEFVTIKFACGQHQDVIQLYSTHFERKGLTPWILNIMLAIYVKLDMVDDAKILLREALVKEVLPDLSIWEDFSKQYLTFSHEIVSVVRNMLVDAARQNTKAYNLYLTHLFFNERPDDALEYYQQNKAAGIQHDLSTYEILIDGFSKTYRPKSAFIMYQDVMAQGMQPTQKMYNMIINLKAGLLDAVGTEQTFRDMVRSGLVPDIYTYSTLLNLYFRNREVSRALAVFSEMQRDNAICINDVVCNIMINGLMMNHEPVAAQEFYKQMIHIGMQPDLITFNSLLKGFVYNKDMPAAINVIREMRAANIEPDVITVTILIDSLLSTTETKTAQSLFDAMQPYNLQPNVVMFGAMINGWVRLGNMTQAVQTFTMMRKHKVTPNVITYTSLIQGFVQSGQLAMATLTFRDMMQCDNVMPDRATFHFMIDGFLGHDRFEEAMVCFRRMRDMKLIPSKDTYFVLLTAVVTQERWKEGGEIMEQISEDGYEIRNLSLLRLYELVKDKNSIS